MEGGGGGGVIIISRASKTDIMRCSSPPLRLKVGDGSGSECQRMCGQGAILPYILLAMRMGQMHRLSSLIPHCSQWV